MIFKKYKINLLIRISKNGPWSILTFLLILIKDILFGPSFYVFSIKNNQKKYSQTNSTGDLSFYSFNSWDEINPKFKEAIDHELKNEYWGKKEWFDLGWKFWIGTLKNELAIVAWTRSSDQSKDFFFPLCHDSALKWQTVTLRRFRGKGMQPALNNHIIQVLFSEGINTIYSVCREFNFPSKNGILKSGFEIIGKGRLERSSRNGIFYSKRNLFIDG